MACCGCVDGVRQRGGRTGDTGSLIAASVPPRTSERRPRPLADAHDAWLPPAAFAAAHAILAEGRGPDPEARAANTGRAAIGERYFVGGIDEAYEILEGGPPAEGVVAVINLFGGLACEKVVRPAYKKLGIAYCGIDAEDEEDYPLLEKHLEEVRNFVVGLPPTGRIFIHCHEGKNRSGAMCVALLMTEHRVPLVAALKQLVKQRPIALTNKSFVDKLVRLANNEGLLWS